MRTICSLAIVFLSLSAPAMRADTIQLTVNSSVLANIISPDDNFWGQYSTVTQKIDYPSLDLGTGHLSIFPVFRCCFRQEASSLQQQLTSSCPPLRFTGRESTMPRMRFPPPDWNAPSIAPTFTNTGTSEVTVSANAITPLGFFDSPTPLIDGNEVSIGNFTFLIEIDGEIMGQLATSGVNWNGYVGGSGQVDIP